MSLLGNLMNHSGGLFYHASALRHARSRWQPFRAAVEQNLMAWPLPLETKTLVIFGASGGHTLPTAFLKKFTQIIGVDPDPLAEMIFRRRFRDLDLNISWVKRKDLLPWFDGQTVGHKANDIATKSLAAVDPRKMSNFRAFLNQHPNSAILFAGLLGQIPFLTLNLSAHQKIQMRKEFLTDLGDRDWLSYHDVFSSPQPLRNDFPSELDATADFEDVARLALKFFPAHSEVVDHETRWLSESAPKTKFAPWSLRSRQNHVMGFVVGVPSS